nr:hypothetical protein [Tanacetum cinerariifolium]
MLIVVPFHNLEIGDRNDPPLGVYIESRFPVNSEPIELLTFTPPVRNSPKSVLVIVYRLLLPPDDIQALTGCYMTPSLIHSWQGLIPITIWSWRFLRQREPFRMLRSSSVKSDSLADACRDLDPVVDQPTLLVAGSNEARADSGSPPSLRLLDPQSDPAEGPS